MSAATHSRSRIAATLRAVATSQLTLWCAFIAVHLVLGFVNLVDHRHRPMGDVTLVYRYWAEQAVVADYWVGIDTDWVYPIVAFVPILLAYAFGPELYGSTWLSLVLVLDTVAFGFVTRWGFARERVGAAWWWIAFLAALGPVSLARIDSVTVPLAIAALLLLSTRPRTAAILLAIATWIKVWPAALLAAIVVASRHRVTVVATGLASSVVVVALALAFGSGTRALSFITEQTGRGLQVESPVSTIWLWQAAAGVADAYVYYDSGILTFQVAGNGVEVASALMTALMGLAAVAVLALGLVAARRSASVAELLPVLSLALVTALLAFNKVGSPQFATWLAVPVILGLSVSVADRGMSFRVPAVLVLVIAALTHVIYPYLYSYLLDLNTGMLVVVTLRNALLFVLLGWAVRELLRLARGKRSAADHPDPDWLPA